MNNPSSICHTQELSFTLCFKISSTFFFFLHSSLLIVYEGKSLETSKTSFGSKTEEVVGRSLSDNEEGSDIEGVSMWF